MAQKESRELARQEPHRPLSPLHEMERMERMFEDFWRRPYAFLSPARWLRTFPEFEEPAIPSVDVYEEQEDVVVKAEIPGIRKEDVEVTFSDNTIRISGEKRKEERVENKDYYRLERSYGSFSRMIQLPAEVDSDQASATFKDGILEIRIPKSREAREKVKKITIR
ncbi:Hsp20/alpha crystallin family protein [Geobacter sp. SVR]|uniref:Hsp20/alpha crystallin family protein n=1 Tax=Geobacter sp. SVR TaxID=2495594 RepID=UPI00143EFAEB|nr:Hsp20/alpha crystallin family protein [Geobacter sp. SVR]BCS54795.1 heat-shock protein Hsp20 [Geobacter sp. SVR]GCF86397.1 heat-shock protein Hsp20 [Geobacter sp. SVR]